MLAMTVTLPVQWEVPPPEVIRLRVLELVPRKVVPSLLSLDLPVNYRVLVVTAPLRLTKSLPKVVGLPLQQVWVRLLWVEVYWLLKRTVPPVLKCGVIRPA